MARLCRGVLCAGALLLLAAAPAPEAWAQSSSNGKAVVLPDEEHDPGDDITVTNATDTPRDLCGGTRERTVSVDLLTSADGIVSGPHIIRLTTVDGQWSVPITLDPALAPGFYKAVATCYDADDARQRGYDPVLFSVRTQQPGNPSVRPTAADPGERVQIASGTATCVPPKGATAPKVRASILDGGGMTRAEGEADVSRDGSWTVSLRAPDAPPQTGSVTAICLASVGAAAPYARYGRTSFDITAPPPPSTTSTAPTTPPSLAPGQTVPPTTVPGPTTTTGPVPPLPGFSAALPQSPVAVPIVAEPTYTG